MINRTTFDSSHKWFSLSKQHYSCCASIVFFPLLIQYTRIWVVHISGLIWGMLFNTCKWLLTQVYFISIWSLTEEIHELVNPYNVSISRTIPDIFATKNRKLTWIAAKTMLLIFPYSAIGAWDYAMYNNQNVPYLLVTPNHLFVWGPCLLFWISDLLVNL